MRRARKFDFDSDDDEEMPWLPVPSLRSRAAKCKTYLVMALALTCFALAVALGAVLHNGRTSGGAGIAAGSGASVCNEAECVVEAAAVLSAMDPTADPCDDFFQYACGGFVEANPVPSDRGIFTQFNVLLDSNDKKLFDVLEATAVAATGPEGAGAPNPLFSKLGAWFSACLSLSPDTPNVAMLQERVVDPLRIASNLTELVVTAQRLGVKALLSLGAGPDDRQVVHNALFVGQSGLTLSSPSFYANASSPALVSLRGVFEKILRGVQYPNAAAVAPDLVAFEIALAGAFVPKVDLRDPNATYNPMTVAELQALSTLDLDWATVLESRAAAGCVATPERVVVSTPQYFRALPSVLASATAETLSAYFAVQGTLAYISAATDSNGLLIEARTDLHEIFSGATQLPERRRTCLKSVDRSLGYMLGRAFVDAAFQPEAKAAADEMVVQIRQAFEGNLPNVDWMDAETRIKALSKAEAVLAKIGFPDWILNDTALLEYYKELPIDATASHLEHRLAAQEWSAHRNIALLNKTNDRHDPTTWDMTPPTVNAYYDPSRNEINFPAGILQTPFFSPKRDPALNYGAIGVVIGHEFTHGFDDQGRLYDNDGNLRSWWSPASAAGFKERAQCIVDQYSEFSIFGHHVNGDLTQGENIADNGGLDISFRAFQALQAAGRAGDIVLPGLDKFTAEQRFFLGFAQVWCYNVREAEAIRRLSADVHSPPRFRVMGSLSNSARFAEAFSCAPDARMNPPNKCILW